MYNSGFYINLKLKAILMIAFMMFTSFSKGQGDFNGKIAQANSEMNLRNMYQRILWQMQATNTYIFDQPKQKVTYTVEEKGYEVYSKPKILGTFNILDKTFLWADKNSSINKALSIDVDAFRKILPLEYQEDKFKSSVEFSRDLLALFSQYYNANGYDYQNQNNTIIFYSLMDIEVIKDGKTLLNLKPKSHIQTFENDVLITLIKNYHSEKLEINKLFNDGEIDDETAFEDIRKVHLKYWLNEDPYFFPSLCWPCDFDEESIVEWDVFKTDDDRTFVMYTTDLGWSTESFAYEINGNATSKKIIIASF